MLDFSLSTFLQHQREQRAQTLYKISIRTHEVFKQYHADRPILKLTRTLLDENSSRAQIRESLKSIEEKLTSLEILTQEEYNGKISKLQVLGSSLITRISVYLSVNSSEDNLATRESFLNLAQQHLQIFIEHIDKFIKFTHNNHNDDNDDDDDNISSEACTQRLESLVELLKNKIQSNFLHDNNYGQLLELINENSSEMNQLLVSLFLSIRKMSEIITQKSSFNHALRQLNTNFSRQDENNIRLKTQNLLSLENLTKCHFLLSKPSPKKSYQGVALEDIPEAITDEKRNKSKNIQKL